VERIVERCAGLDVHKSSVTACVRIAEASEGLHQEIREFATTTRGLLLLRDWLASFRVRLVGMEATGVYWKPIYYMLEDDFELWLLNARHLKNVPGRKTDVKDAEWICQLVEHGLVRPSFVPPKEIRELRNLTRYRKAQIEERTREVQRLEKVLQDAGIKLSSVATRVLGASGRAFAQMRWLAGPPTRRCWRSWPGAAFAPSCPRSGMLWRDASLRIMPSWWARYWPTSTTSMSLLASLASRSSG
jgi:transposase